jgi:short-subunit dehydrogenase
MTKQALVIGSSGGIGSACVNKLELNGFKVDAWSRDTLDLDYPSRIFGQDLSKYDLLINCAGHSRGTHKGFLQNSLENQLSQINVNFVSNIFLLKHYALSRVQGHFVWFSTSLLDQSRPFHSTYAGSKAASKFAIDLVRQEATHINILEVKVGPTRTMFKYTNFEGTQTVEQINSIYDQEQALDPGYVAQQTVQAIDSNLSYIHIK